jgi:hypothetical protein
VRFWDAASGAALGEPLRCNSDRALVLAVCADGFRIASWAAGAARCGPGTRQPAWRWASREESMANASFLLRSARMADAF